MSTKDLNLSLDQGLAHSGQAHTNTPSNTSTGRHAAPAPQAVPRGKGQWKAAAFIMLLNISFLLAAAYWLFERTNLSQKPTQLAGNPRFEQLEAAVTTATENLGKVQSQLDLMATELAEQRLLLTATLEGLEAQQRSAEASISTAAAKEKKPEPARRDSWYVNLGNFSDKKQALGLQQKISAIGYQPVLASRGQGAEREHDLLLTGFKNRESAELAAKLLMEQANLDSLWVAQDK